MIILNGTKEEHLDMLEGGIIQRLLEEKWKTFARVREGGGIIQRLMEEKFKTFSRQGEGDRGLGGIIQRLPEVKWKTFAMVREEGDREASSSASRSRRGRHLQR